MKASGSFVLTVPAQTGPTTEQLRVVSHAIRLWSDPGETIVAKLQPDGRVLLGACSAGTWDFTHIERDGRPGHPWF